MSAQTPGSRRHPRPERAARPALAPGRPPHGPAAATSAETIWQTTLMTARRSGYGLDRHQDREGAGGEGGGGEGPRSARAGVRHRRARGQPQREAGAAGRVLDDDGSAVAARHEVDEGEAEPHALARRGAW